MENPINPYSICPLCGNKMTDGESGMMIVMDGNYIYQCTDRKSHRFWVHPFTCVSGTWLHLNSNADEMTNISNGDYTWYDSKWIRKDLNWNDAKISVIGDTNETE